MAFSYLSLLNAKSAQQIINESLAFMAAPPDPSLVTVQTANWRTGGPYRTLLYRMGQEAALLYNIVAGFAGSASLPQASGGWLDWLGEGFFGEPRQGGEFATVAVQFTIPLGAGPLGPIELRAQTGDGKVYASTQAETLPAGPATVTFTLRAVQAGSVYNVGAGLVNQLITPNVLGISVTNPAAATGGYDVESDDRYRQRLAAKWGVLSTGSTQAAYVYWALTASKEVQKVRVYANLHLGFFDPSWVTVILAGNNTGVSPQALIDVYQYTNPRIPITAKLAVGTANPITYSVGGLVQVFAPYFAEAPAAIGASLADLTRRIPIGGYDAGPVPPSEINDAVFWDGRKVYDVTLASIAPISLAYNDLLVLVDATSVSSVPI